MKVILTEVERNSLRGNPYTGAYRPHSSALFPFNIHGLFNLTGLHLTHEKVIK